MYLEHIPQNILDMPFPERIKALAELAHRADPKLRVFGAGKHKYTFAAPADITAIRRFERSNGLMLPDEYVRFLTEVGNGGAGADYGMFSFEAAANNLPSKATYGPTLYDYDDPVAVYVEKAQRLDDINGKEEFEAEYDRLFNDITRGMFIIGTAGCTYDYFIMYHGRKRGCVGGIDWNLMPQRSGSPVLYDLTLNEWLEDYLTRIILGKLVSYPTFDAVDMYADIGRKRCARRDEWPNTVSAPEQPAPQPTPTPASQPTPPPAPQPAPRPTVVTPPPKPAPRIFRVGDLIRHARYGSGIITNVVGNIITADYMECGSKSIMLPYDRKDILD